MKLIRQPDSILAELRRWSISRRLQPDNCAVILLPSLITLLTSLTSRLTAQASGDFPFILPGPVIVEESLLNGAMERPLRIGTYVEKVNGGPGNGDRFYLDVFAAYRIIGMDQRDGRWLKLQSMVEPEVVWSEGVRIGPDAVVTGNVGSPLEVGDCLAPSIGGYYWQQWFATSTGAPTGPPTLREEQATVATNRTSLLYGLKIFQDGDTNSAFYGWVELVRDRGDAISPLRFGRHALDFIPNRAIRAGSEPERPVVSSVVSASGTSLSWEGIYTANGFALERAETLEPPVSWVPVEIPPGSTNLVLSNTNSSSGFYRLSRQ
jgi:hypothetical protein